MTLEIIKEKIEKMDVENISIWEKYGKFRVYVPRDGREQAGFVTPFPEDRKGYNSGYYNGWGYEATRPGNVGSLMKFLDDLGIDLEKTEMEEK